MQRRAATTVPRQVRAIAIARRVGRDSPARGAHARPPRRRGLPLATRLHRAGAASVSTPGGSMKSIWIAIALVAGAAGCSKKSDTADPPRRTAEAPRPSAKPLPGTETAHQLLRGVGMTATRTGATQTGLATIFGGAAGPLASGPMLGEGLAGKGQPPAGKGLPPAGATPPTTGPAMPTTPATPTVPATAKPIDPAVAAPSG